MNADTIPNLSPNPGQIPWDYLRSSASIGGSKLFLRQLLDKTPNEIKEIRMSYVEGFIVPVPRKKLAVYRSMAPSNTRNALPMM